MVAPVSPVEQRLRALHARYRDLDAGDVASYIPELATAFPDSFGICVATVDGEVYEVGDSREPFTIQSVSKPFLFGLALEDYGREGLLRRVGVEPTGDPFNAIVLDEVANRPPNPMVNAGAIAVTGLVQGRDVEERWARIHGVLEAFAGRPLKVDDAVALSESRTGHRNRAIAHLMRTFDMVREDVDEVLELYFRQCAVQVDAVDLALMGATLAAGGRNPSTGERAIAAEHLPSVLSVMTSCGMYDASGTWLYRVGLPAKSGVGGGVVAVLPGQVGIGVFSPRLDRNGNSVRGLRVCEDLSQDLGMHLFSGTRWAADTVRAVYDRGVGDLAPRPHRAAGGGAARARPRGPRRGAAGPARVRGRGAALAPRRRAHLRHPGPAAAPGRRHGAGPRRGPGRLGAAGRAARRLRRPRGRRRRRRPPQPGRAGRGPGRRPGPVDRGRGPGPGAGAGRGTRSSSGPARPPSPVP